MIKVWDKVEENVKALKISNFKAKFRDKKEWKNGSDKLDSQDATNFNNNSQELQKTLMMITAPQ